MRCIIAGGRDYEYNEEDVLWLDYLRTTIPITLVLSGMAAGADALGYRWAKHRGIPVEKYPADWEKYGKKAGFIRNYAMALNADALIVFPGGKGTNNMISLAETYSLPIFKSWEMKENG